MFRVSSVDYPSEDDREFSQLVDAEEHAIVLSYNDSVIAVIDIESDEIVMLVYQQVAFTH